LVNQGNDDRKSVSLVLSSAATNTARQLRNAQQAPFKTSASRKTSSGFLPILAQIAGCAMTLSAGKWVAASRRQQFRNVGAADCVCNGRIEQDIARGIRYPSKNVADLAPGFAVAILAAPVGRL